MTPSYRTDAYNIFGFIILACVCLRVMNGVTAQYAKIESNGYYDVLIAINEDLPEDETLIKRIKTMFTDTSAYLHKATRNRAYFQNITILIPHTWKVKPEYERATTENFEKADIRIDKPNPRLPDSPYVQSSGTPCSPGKFMHLTKKYVTEKGFAIQRFGSYEKVITHEWAHLRWGVKDEYPYRGKPHFYVNDDGDILPVRCSSEVTGKALIRTATGSHRACKMDPKTGMYEIGCIFRDDLNSPATASLMYKHYLTNIATFCDDRENIQDSFHNGFAPNRQNNECHGRSTWDVILSHADFKNGANPPRHIDSTKPNFRLVRKNITNTVIILDVSESMGRNFKLERLRRAAKNYIEHKISTNSYLGIVTFNTAAYIVLPLTRVREDNRGALANKLPTRAYGGTDISAGLHRGLDVLAASSNRRAREGGVLILITDGEGSFSITKELLRSKVTVHTIAISSAAQPRLEALSDKTGGNAFFDPASSTSQVLVEAFDAIGSKTRQKKVQIKIQGNSAELKSSSSVNILVTIDKYAGKSIQFQSSYIVRPVELTVRSPSGKIYNFTSPGYVIDTGFKSVTLHVNLTTLEVGEWTANIYNPHTRSQAVNFETRSVTDLGDNDTVEPIIASAELSTSTLEYPGYVVMMVTVTQGYLPVGGANVTALITTPNNKIIRQSLRDDGAGIDAAKGDGIYCSRFTRFDGNGRYSVDAFISNKDGSAYFSFEDADGAPVQDIAETKPNVPIPFNFEREALAGSFDLSRYYSNQKDPFPPADIHDLRVESLSYENQTVTLVFTAPGDDYDTGMVSGYDIRISRSFKRLHSAFNNQTHVKQENITSGNLTGPLDGGKTERFTIHVPARGEKVVFVFGIRAFDGAGNYAGKSNLVSANLQHIPSPSSYVRRDTPSLPLIYIIAFAMAGTTVLSLLLSAFIMCLRRTVAVKGVVSVAEKGDVSVAEKGDVSIEEKSGVPVAEKDGVPVAEKGGVLVAEKSGVPFDDVISQILQLSRAKTEK